MTTADLSPSEIAIRIATAMGWKRPVVRCGRVPNAEYFGQRRAGRMHFDSVGRSGSRSGVNFMKAMAGETLRCGMIATSSYGIKAASEVSPSDANITLPLTSKAMPEENLFEAAHAVKHSKGRVFRDYGDLSRFNLSRFIVDPETGCHVWQGALSDSGYAIVGTNRDGAFRAARAVFQRDKGPLLPGEFPDHLCKNRACINPDHLERVSNAENTRRGSKAKLSWELVRQIRAIYRENRTPFRTLARMFGVSGSAISNIINQKRWREGT